MKKFNEFLEGKIDERVQDALFSAVDKIESAVQDIESMPELYRIQFKGPIAQLKQIAGNFRYITGL